MKKYRLFTLMGVGIFLAIIIFFVFINKTADGDYVARINGRPVEIWEYQVYLYEQIKTFEETGGKDIWETEFDGLNAADVAKQNALNSIVFIKTAVAEAEKSGITLSEGDMSDLEAESLDFLSEINGYELRVNPKISLTYEQVYGILKETRLQAKLYDTITKGYEPSEIDFDAYASDYYNKNKKELADVKIMYVYIPYDGENGEGRTEKRIEEAYDKILSGEEFAVVAEAYSKSPEKGIIDVKDASFPQEIEDEIYKLGEGEISDILETDSGYYIFNAVEVAAQSIQDLKEEIRQEYIDLKKDEIYREQSDKWINDAKIEKNMDIWESVDIF